MKIKKTKSISNLEFYRIESPYENSNLNFIIEQRVYTQNIFFYFIQFFTKIQVREPYLYYF
jgi:hypothetical protein